MASKSAKPGGRITNDSELRIVMLGKAGIGKSATGNSILGSVKFGSEFAAESVNTKCIKNSAEVDGQTVVVIDTPGLYDTRFESDKTIQDLGQCIRFASPGPHVFLVVIRFGRFTTEEKKTISLIQKVFGKEADKYSMVLFTGGNSPKNRTIEEFLETSKDLKELVARCHGHYHVFNNELTDETTKRSQVTELLKKIRVIVQNNGESHYTSAMFQEAEKKLPAETGHQLKTKWDNIEKEKMAIKQELQKKFDQDLQEMKKQLAAEMERERQKIEHDREMRMMREERERERKNFTEREKMVREERERERRDFMEREKMLREERERERRDFMERMKEEMERQRRDYIEREEKLRESYERMLSEKTSQSIPSTGDIGDVVDIITNPTGAVTRGAIGLVSKLIK